MQQKIKTQTNVLYQQGITIKNYQIKVTTMDFKQLEFATFMIGCVAMRLNKTCSAVYKMMEEKKVIDEYIVECYDSLHTYSREYATDEVIKYMRYKGIKV